MGLTPFGNVFLAGAYYSIADEFCDSSGILHHKWLYLL